MGKPSESLEASMNNILSGLNDDAESKILARDNIQPNELKILLEMTEDELYEAKDTDCLTLDCYLYQSTEVLHMIV